MVKVVIHASSQAARGPGRGQGPTHHRHRPPRPPHNQGRSGRGPGALGPVAARGGRPRWWQAEGGEISIDESKKDNMADRSTLIPNQMRATALRRLRKQSDFRVHLLIYLAVNGLLVFIWAWTGAPLFWPIFPIFGWGIGVVANAWDAHGRKPATEDQLQREVRRLQR